MIPSFPKRGYKRRNVEHLLLDGLSQRSDLEEGASFPYKECRIKSSGFDPNAFNHTRDVILPTFVEQGANIISCDTAEADDLAAGLARCAIRSSAKEAIIITGDSDFAQLVTDQSKFTTLARHVYSRSKGYLIRKWLCFEKILSGDKSDNIPSIKPRLEPKTAITF
jgi:5'-3' exonuclease